MAEEKRAKPTGHFPTISVYADTLGEAFHKVIIECYEKGYRIETPKHREGVPLGFDAHITANILFPDREPILHKYGIVEDARGLMQYILEVTHGIHNHWKKDPNDPNATEWGYTYNERFDPQTVFALARMKHDYEKKGRISGRDYFFATWRAEEDSILEQADPPCLQNGQLRFIPDDKGQYFLNYITDWRSRDEAKAWTENIVAQIELQKLIAAKASDMLGLEIKMGSYIDTSTSLHIYGAYLEEGFDNLVERMRRNPTSDFMLSLDDYLGDRTKLKRIIAAQTDATDRGLGKNLDEAGLKQHGYNLDTFLYPEEWDTWPKSWDREPDPKILRRN